MELNVQVAEALGWEWWRSKDTGRRCLYAPGRHPSWMTTRADMSEELVSDWEDYRARHIPRYDTDWSATGPLIERLRLWVQPCDHDGKPSHWVSYSDLDDFDAEPIGPTPLVAVCLLILSLHAAGKLPESDVR